MYEIAKAPPYTPFPAIEATAGFAEIGDWGKFAVDGPGGVPARVELVAGFLRGVFIFEAGVDVADEIYRIWSRQQSLFLQNRTGKRPKRRGELGKEGVVRTIVIVVTYHHLLRLPPLAHLAPEIFIERIEMVLQLRRVHLVLGVVGGVLVEVGEEDGLAVGGLDVFARAAVAMTAGTDFVVEGAVDFVLFRAEDGGEVAVVGLSVRAFLLGLWGLAREEMRGAYLAMMVCLASSAAPKRDMRVVRSKDA